MSNLGTITNKLQMSLKRNIIWCLKNIALELEA